MADQSFTVFGKALRENGESVLILDDLDFNLTAPPSATTIEGTIDALHDFCPNVCVIRVTALPCPREVDPIQVGRLDVADTRSYLNKAPRPVQLSSIIDYNRVHRGTGGLPIYLDDFIGALDVTNIEEAIAQADAQTITTADTLHESIVKEIKELEHCTVEEMQRTRALLWTLTILDQGESLGAIKRLDGRAPIWPKNANHLQSRGCLESVTITSKLATAGQSAPASDGDKILRIPRLVRDHVQSIMTDEERQDIIRKVANLYFSDDWRMGTVRMRRRLAIGTEISTHQSGNELTILKHILKSPEVYFGKTPMVAFYLALSYASQLKSKGFYGEAYEAAKDTLAIVESRPTVYPKAEVYHIQLLAASCARMVGEREACMQYLQTSLPFVRESGVKATLTDALVTYSMALLSLKRGAEAKTAAEEILKLAPKDSSDYLQAKATLAEINMPRPKAIQYLRKLATKAKNLGHFTVADNATLEVVSDSDNTEEKLKMLNDIKSRRDLSYNFVRATIRRIETLIDAGRESELTGTDREDLWFSYNLAYSQRMASIFNWCHRVCWKYLEATNGNQQLGELYMHSSFVWRLRGEATEELAYTIKLQAESMKKPSIGPIMSIVGYLTRRIAALAKAVGAT
jgi:tetratricopeptide (TPR) repeat protein